MIKASGTYIVTDNATKIAYLIIVKGVVPCLKIVSAINFTKFQESGDVVSYKQTSSILKAMENNPELFKFEEIAIVTQKQYINEYVPEETPIELKVTNEELVKYGNYYREHNCDESDLLGYIAVNRNLSIAEAQSITNLVINRVRHGHEY